MSLDWRRIAAIASNTAGDCCGCNSHRRLTDEESAALSEAEMEFE